MEHSHPLPESGNVFYYLFIAIALLGALSYAVAQSGRRSVSTLIDDREKLLATEIIEYADTTKKTVSMLRLRGTQLADLRFAHANLDAAYGNYGDDPANEIFNPQGGALVYKAPSADALTTPTDFKFVIENEISGSGSTCGAAGCVDLVILLENITTNVCLKINDLLGVTNPSGAPPEDNGMEVGNLYGGTIQYSETIGDDAGEPSLRNQSSACIQDTGNGNNVFYEVLWSQ